MKLQINIDGVLRDMNENEIAQYKIDQLENSKLKTANEAKAVAKQELLDRLGITVEEAALLLS